MFCCRIEQMPQNNETFETGYDCIQSIECSLVNNSGHEFKQTSDYLTIKIDQDQSIDLDHDVHGQGQNINLDDGHNQFNEVGDGRDQGHLTEVNKGQDNFIERGDSQIYPEAAEHQLDLLRGSVSQNTILESRYGYLEPRDQNEAEATQYNVFCDNLSVTGNATSKIANSNSTLVASFPNFMIYESSRLSLRTRIRAKALLLTKFR